MNWDAIGAIAELLGAVGVIVSLVYLATQVRHSREQMDLNTRALRVGSYQQFNQGMHVDMWRAWTVPGFESAVIRGLNDFHQLQEEDAVRFHWWIGSVMQTYDNAYYQYRAGMFDEDRWKMHLADLRQIFSGRGAGTHVALGGGATQWWRSISKENLSPEFVALVEEILAEEPDLAK